MKILFVSNNLRDGGAQRVTAVVASQLAEMGHDVSMLLYARNEKEYPLSPKVSVTALRNSFREYKQMSELSRLRFIRSYVRKLRPDAGVGFLEGGYGLYLATLGMRFVKVASVRNNLAVLRAKKGLRAMVDRLWFSRASAVVLQTSRQKEHAADTGWKCQRVIANPVSEEALSMPAHDYSRPCRRVVMAGRLAEQKNYPMAISAMEQVVRVHPDAVLDIFGKGGEMQALQQLIESRGLQEHVFLRGWTPDLLSEYEKRDIYLLSSDYEGMPNALMEAMAAGLPCVATDCDTGPADLIADGEHGFLVPVNDAQALARRILRLMDMSPAERQQMGENARRRMREEFNSHTIAQAWESLLQELVRKEKG